MPQQNQTTTQAIHLVPASVGIRILALVLDMIPIIMIVWLLQMYFSEFLYPYLSSSDYRDYGGDYYRGAYYMARSVLIPFYLMIATGLAYGVVMEQSNLMGTLSKGLLGIQVLNKNYKKPTFRQALIRNLGKCLLLFGGIILIWIGETFDLELFFMLGAIGMFGSWIAAGIVADKNTNKQFFYDQWAGTYVVKKPKS